MGVYVRRQDAIFREQRDWTLREFAGLPVAGIALRHDNRWRVAGRFIWYYHENQRR